MKLRVISMFLVLITGTSSQQSLYRDLFGSFGTVIDSENNFLKTVVSTITAPFRLPGSQQSEASAGLVQQAVPLKTPAFSGADISVLHQLANNPQLLEYYNRQISAVTLPPSIDQASQVKALLLKNKASLSRGMYSDDPQSGNTPQQVRSSPSLSDIPMLIRLLNAPQTTPAPNSPSKDQIAEIRSLLIQLLTQIYGEMVPKVALEDQRTAPAGTVETSTSASSPPTSPDPVENIEQSKPSLPQPDPVNNNEQSTS